MTAGFIILSAVTFCGNSASLLAEDTDNELQKPASWTTPKIEGVVEGFGSWLTGDKDREAAELESTDFLERSLQQVTLSQRLDVIVNAIAMVRPDVDKFMQQLREQENADGGPKVTDFKYDIDDVMENEFVGNHVRLYFGRWLAQNHFYDESLEQLTKIKLASVFDPATLLYYRGLMQHQLLQRDECLLTAKKLLENEDEIPRRYAAISRLMIADIEPMEVDSLDEISRLMNDVGRRTGLSRAGTRVIDGEKTVIEKLDKLIEDLEKQQQQQQSKSKASASGQAPTGPIQASQVAGGGATGDADRKRQIDGGDWGDLPPAQRAAAMAEMAKDLPPHYRAVIEEYFRRLAEKIGTSSLWACRSNGSGL